MSRRTMKIMAILGAGALLSACGPSNSGEPTTNESGGGILRVAMGSPGEAQIRVWDAAAAEFEEATGVKVEMNYQDDDLYETIGLPNLLNGRNAPDIYFEWAGERMENRVKDGFAADFGSEVKDGGELAGIFSDEALAHGVIDGKQVLLPHTADVTNVLWFNTEIFAENQIEPPTTWAELLTTCDTLNDAGIIPIASGNKDLWAAGNWLSHVASRVVGEDVYDATLSGEATFDTPEWLKAFETIKELADHNCVNDSINAVDDNEGAQLFFQGKAAMHAIGSWLVSWAIDEAPDLQFDFFNLPTIDGAGDQESVIGVVTGHAINANSSAEMQKNAVKFLALIYSEKYVDMWREAELSPMGEYAIQNQSDDTRITALMELMEYAPVIVSPPDTGYDLKVADALYSGVAEVIGEQASPADALKEVQRKVG